MESVCNERHERIDARLGDHDETLKDHGEKIGGLEVGRVKNETNIENICKNLGNLTKGIWGLTIVLAGSFISFFFYAVQNHIDGK